MHSAKPRARTSWAGAVATVAIVASGCGSNPKNSAQEYLTDLKLFNYPACYQKLSRQDQRARTLDEFLTEIPMAPDVSRDWFRTIEAKMEYALGEAKVDGDRGTVAVRVTMPDLVRWEHILGAAQGANGPLEERAQESLRDNRFPSLSYDDAMVMVKERGGWKLVADFPQKERLAKLHREAIELYHKHDLERAIAAYNQLLAELDKTSATGNLGLRFRYLRELSAIETVKAERAQAQGYVAKLLLTNADLKMTASGVPGIFGQITNAGARPLDEVEIRVTYYMGKGKKRKVVFTEDHTPIATPLEFTNFNHVVAPLRPNETRDFGFKLRAPAEIESKAKMDVTVTMVAFSQLNLPGKPASTTAAGGQAGVPAAAPARALPPAMPKG